MLKTKRTSLGAVATLNVNNPKFKESGKQPWVSEHSVLDYIYLLYITKTSKIKRYTIKTDYEIPNGADQSQRDYLRCWRRHSYCLLAHQLHTLENVLGGTLKFIRYISEGESTFPVRMSNTSIAQALRRRLCSNDFRPGRLHFNAYMGKIASILGIGHRSFLNTLVKNCFWSDSNRIECEG